MGLGNEPDVPMDAGQVPVVLILQIAAVREAARLGQESPYRRSLNGDWQFRLLERPQDAGAPPRRGAGSPWIPVFLRA